MNEKFFTLSPEKQARITNAALEVFARNDYKHASTDDIAAKAGISKGLLFYYFRNKQSLYLYLYDYALEQVRGQVLRQKLDGVTDFFELMHIGARAKLELLTRCPYLLEFSIRAFYSRGEAVSDAVQARLNGDLTGSFAQYFSNIDFSKFPDCCIYCSFNIFILCNVTNNTYKSASKLLNFFFRMLSFFQVKAHNICSFSCKHDCSCLSDPLCCTSYQNCLSVSAKVNVKIPVIHF